MDNIELRPITSTAEWLDWRCDDATSTDVAALLGEHPFKTPLRVWAHKKRLIMGEEETAVLRRGRWAQPAVFAMLLDERPGWQTREAKVYLRDPAIRMGATPDGVILDPEREGIGALECKTVLQYIFERFWTNGEPPIYYQLQALTAAMLMKASWVCIATLIMDSYGGWHPHVFIMERHPAAEAKIRQAVIKFWQMFDAGRMPIVNLEQDTETIKEIYPKPLTKTPVDLSADNELPESLAERAILKAEVRTREKRISQIDTDVKAKLGVHELGILPGWKIDWGLEHIKEHLVAAKDRRVLRITEAA